MCPSGLRGPTQDRLCYACVGSNPTATIFFYMNDELEEPTSVEKDLSLSEVYEQSKTQYFATTCKKEQLCDVYILFCLAIALVAVIFKATSLREPFFPFFSCFFTACGSFTFAVILRGKLAGESFKRALAEFVLSNLLLFVVSLINLN